MDVDNPIQSLNVDIIYYGYDLDIMWIYYGYNANPVRIWVVFLGLYCIMFIGHVKTDYDQSIFIWLTNI